MPAKDLKETYARHYTDGIRLRVYDTVIGTPYHWHDEYEFIVVQQGGCICRINGEHYSLCAGEALLLRPGELHTFLDTTHSCKAFAVVFHPYLVTGTDCAGFFDRDTAFWRRYTDEHPAGQQILGLLEEAHTLFHSSLPAKALHLKAKMVQIFSILLSAELFTSTPTAHNLGFAKLEPLLRYVEQHYTEKITLQALATQGCCSISSILHLFRQNTGQTPMEYIANYRVYRASELLQTTDTPVLDIALAVGFNHVGHFINTFRRQTGQTPLQYRRKTQNLSAK